jgi:hypothetical protein
LLDCQATKVHIVRYNRNNVVIRKLLNSYMFRASLAHCQRVYSCIKQSLDVFVISSMWPVIGSACRFECVECVHSDLQAVPITVHSDLQAVPITVHSDLQTVPITVHSDLQAVPVTVHSDLQAVPITAHVPVNRTLMESDSCT